MRPLRLGVNIDHVATLRNARGGAFPDPIQAALLAKDAGADGITAHLREDRRHIRDVDIFRLCQEVALPLNLEMAATEDMVRIACDIKPHAVCIVPEKRHEVTTEGGLDARAQQETLRPLVARLSKAGCRVSLFLDPRPEQIEVAHSIGAQVVELHTGAYCNVTGDAQQKELDALRKTASLVAALGMECHAGHGLSYATVGAIAAIGEIVELNIGHFLIAQAVFSGLASSIQTMRRLMQEARA